MSDLFDRLQNELDDRNEDSGITPMDLLDLPDELRRLMRKMLRSRTMKKREIVDYIATWDKPDQISGKDLDNSIAQLVDQGWLIKIGEGDSLGYRVNLRKKKGSTLSSSIWGALDAKLTKKDND